MLVRDADPIIFRRNFSSAGYGTIVIILLITIQEIVHEFLCEIFKGRDVWDISHATNHLLFQCGFGP